MYYTPATIAVFLAIFAIASVVFSAADMKAQTKSYEQQCKEETGNMIVYDKYGNFHSCIVMSTYE